jgi:transcription elongation factor GreA-like protein
MTIKTGNIVSHAGALEWGVGKVLEVNAAMATIHFSDGVSRKIASSHFTTLKPASVASYLPPPEKVQAKTIRAPRKAKASK